MTNKQPEALRLADLIERYNSGVHSQAIVEDYCKAAAELRRLHAQNAKILEALRMNAQALAWLTNGKCRGFHPKLPTANDALDAARATIEAVEKQP